MFYSEETVGAQPAGKTELLCPGKWKKNSVVGAKWEERVEWDGTEYF